MTTLAELTPTHIQIQIWNMVLRPKQGSTPKRAHHVPKSGVFRVRLSTGRFYECYSRQDSRRVRAVLNLAPQGLDAEQEFQLVYLAHMSPGSTSKSILKSFLTDRS